MEQIKYHDNEGKYIVSVSSTDNRETEYGYVYDTGDTENHIQYQEQPILSILSMCPSSYVPYHCKKSIKELKQASQSITYLSSEWRIYASAREIIVCSKFRIPFERPKNDRYISYYFPPLKKNLQDAISRLHILDNELLLAQYYVDDPTHRQYDLENVLFYNIGMHTFKRLMSGGISFSAMQECDVVRTKKRFGITSSFYKNIYRYSPVAKSAPHIDAHFIVAEWDKVMFPSGKQKYAPHDFWKALKCDRFIKINAAALPNETAFSFGMQIILRIPKQAIFSLQNVLKPLLDGIIAAFHSADNKVIYNTQYILEKLGCDEKLLSDNQIGVLGKNNFVYPYRNAVKWNPQDDRLKELFLVISRSDEFDYYMSGKLYVYRANNGQTISD